MFNSFDLKIKIMELWRRHRDVIVANWHLGVTAFGGPPVQFQTFHQKFVEELRWIDEPMYQQIFAISQSLPGSASIKMIFTINLIHGGFMAGFISFLLFSLPGAIGMYGLAVGVSRVGTTLPIPVYALLSGLNAATVGIIALAAVRLAEKAITDRLTRALVYLGGTMGILYTALWYYPVLMIGGGIVTTVWDLRCLHAIAGLFKRCWARPAAAENQPVDDVEICRRDSWVDARSAHGQTLPPTPFNSRRESKKTQSEVPSSRSTTMVPTSRYASPPPATTPPNVHKPEPNPLESLADFPSMSWKFGTSILVFFVFSFIVIITAHVVISGAPRGFSLFADLYLAGTIIFGGGPVVIPLLREYIVTQGWVSPRDFLLGLAIIQSFPGPNFNFAIYLGSLATARTTLPSFCGALIAFVAIYTPGLLIVVGFTGLWRILRSRTWFLSVLRGVNASAVGLVYAAVYKLWQIGYLTVAMQGGLPLGTDPWLVAITATAYVAVAWFRVNPPVAILLGGAMGMLRFAIVTR